MSEPQTLTVSVACDDGSAEDSQAMIEQVFDALTASTTRNVLITQDGNLGIEIAIDSL